MSGKICNRAATDQPTLREAKSYADGRTMAAEGTAITYAAASTGVVENDNALTWTSVLAGDGVQVELLDPGVAGAALSVSASVTKVTVNLATGAAGNILTGVEGNDNAITWTPTTPTLRYAVALVDPSGNDQVLGIVVSGSLITVNLATGPAGAITSTPADIIAAIALDAEAAALVTPTDTGASAGTAAVVAESDAIGDLASTAAQVDAAVDALGAAAALLTPSNTGISDGSGVALAAALQLLSGSNVGHIAGTRDADLFLAGHSSWVANPAGLVAQDCNAYPYGGGYS